MLKKIRSDEKGMGLVLVLIVCSLVGAAALYLMDLSKVSQQKIARDDRVLSYQQVVKIVRHNLYSGDNCTTALKDTPIAGAFNRDGMSIELDLKLPINPKILKKPETVAAGEVPRDVWFLAGGTSIKDVLLYVTERVRTPVRLAVSGSEIWSSAKGYILIIPGHPGVGAKLARGRQYRIPIFLYYGRDDKILKSCFDPGGDAFFCTVMGGAYDVTATNIDMRCQPDRTCFPYKAGIVNNPGLCPATPPYVASKIGYVTGGPYASVLGNLWICDWCNQNALQAEFKGGYYYEPYPPTPYELLKNVKPDPFVGPAVSP